MKARNILTVGALALAVAGAARADFILTGSQHLDVTTYHNFGDLYHSSTADILSGGSIYYANVYDNARLNVRRPSGLAIDTVWVYNAGQIAVFSGSVSELYAHNTHPVEISGGRVDHLGADGTATMDISGGSVGSMQLFEASSVDIRGGDVSVLSANMNNSVDITGGSVHSLYAGGTCRVDISGGSVSALSASKTSTVTFRGYDFCAKDGLSLDGDEVLGTGLLTGKWFDGTAWAIPILKHDYGATIRAVPEPASLALLALGGLALIQRRFPAGPSAR